MTRAKRSRQMPYTYKGSSSKFYPMRNHVPLLKRHKLATPIKVLKKISLTILYEHIFNKPPTRVFESAIFIHALYQPTCHELFLNPRWTSCWAITSSTLPAC